MAGRREAKESLSPSTGTEVTNCHGPVGRRVSRVKGDWWVLARGLFAAPLAAGLGERWQKQTGQVKFEGFP